MSLLNRPSFGLYYSDLERAAWRYLDAQDPSYLLQVDFDEYLDHLEAQFRWEPLTWHEDKMTIEPFTEKVKRQDRYTGRTYVRDEPRFRLRIPVDPHPQRADYLKLRPGTISLSSTEPDWRFEGDVLVLEVEGTQQGVEDGLKDIRFWIGGRNKDIEEGVRNLRNRVLGVWENKRKRVEEQYGQTQAVLQKLNIRLHQDPEARGKPVDIKPRQLRTVIEKPKPRARPAEPSLKHEDVVGLVDFIEQYAQTFEVTPKTYAKMVEEELRDLLMGMMNANYPGSTTAETFSKHGKTDISLRLEAGHVLVCECKFWGGAKAYGDAISQLFGYVTWRQTYGVLIHFCRLKDMTVSVAEGKRATGEHSTFTTGTLHQRSDSRFVSRHSHPQDASKQVEVHHLFVDLSV